MRRVDRPYQANEEVFALPGAIAARTALR